MKLDFRMTDGKWNVMAITGRIDAETAQDLDKAIKELVDKGYNWLALDFATVAYLSSAGLRVLLATHKLLEEKKGKLALISVMDSVENIIQIAGFDSFLTMVKKQDDLNTL